MRRMLRRRSSNGEKCGDCDNCDISLKLMKRRALPVVGGAGLWAAAREPQ